MNDEPFNVFVYVNDSGMSVFDVYPDDILVVILVLSMVMDL